MSKHTKGPWKLQSKKPELDDCPEFFLQCAEGYLGCIDSSRRENEANARLIAAAPELYGELVNADAQMQMAYECVEAGRYDEALLHLGAMSRTRRAAIAKARGEA